MHLFEYLAHLRTRLRGGYSSALVRAVSGATATVALLLAVPHGVRAGPVELLNDVGLASSDPQRLVARWVNGGGGFLMSNDRGASYQLTCYSAVSPTLMWKSVQAFVTASDGSMCLGTADQVFCSDATGCGWKEATEISGQWIADFAEDPTDSQVMYLCTGTSQGNNGVYVRETRDSAWKPFGTQLPAWFSRLHVVKNGTGKRFYVSSQENVMSESADGGPPIQQLKYFVRYSDDNAQTWTSHYYEPLPERANLRLVAVDPSNPDRVVVALIRSAELAPDDLLFSDKRGEPNSYVKIGSVTEFSGAVFTPDGALYYGDNDQMTPGLYKVAKLGEAPTKLSGSYKVGCLGYDAANDRLYVCADWKFGTADGMSGEFTMLFNIMTASTFLECPGEPPMSEQCAPAFRSPNFCDVTHYPGAPVCVEYFGTEVAGSGADSGTSGAGGALASAGTSGKPATNGSAGNPPREPELSAGTTATGRAGRGGTDASSNKSTGCGVAARPGHGSPLAPIMFLMIVASIHRRRRPQGFASTRRPQL